MTRKPAEEKVLCSLISAQNLNREVGFKDDILLQPIYVIRPSLYMIFHKISTVLVQLRLRNRACGFKCLNLGFLGRRSVMSLNSDDVRSLKRPYDSVQGTAITAVSAGKARLTFAVFSVGLAYIGLLCIVEQGLPLLHGLYSAAHEDKRLPSF